MIGKILLVFGGCFILGQVSKAEPWLSNRFAQNCAGCHAPGRANRVPKERRCTLSCQGCHTNPNGGGIRSQYGLWNSERWLRSKYSKAHKVNNPTPAPYSKQVYGPLLEAYKTSDPVHKKISRKFTKKQANAKLKKDSKKILNVGYKLKTANLDKVDEKDYDKYNDTRWKYNNKSAVIDLASATKYDPIRKKTTEWFRPSLDARLFYLSAKYDDSDRNYSGMSLMAFDLGAEIKPFMNNLKFVFETRYANSPKNSQWDTIFNSGSFTRSAYVLVDDLPYNTYVMYGLFRPLFGYYDPNHTTLAQEVMFRNVDSSRGGYNGVIKGVSFGTAPNVPFMNVHLITPGSDVSLKETGVAVNLGARFVTMGASAVFSYWNSKFEGTQEFERNMWSMNFGGQLGDFTLNADLLRFDKTEGDTKNGGNVITFDTRYRLFKENYLLLNIASSNTAKDLSPGDASELSLGYKSYLYSGVELEFLMAQKNETKSSVKSKTDYIQSQLHLYF